MEIGRGIFMYENLKKLNDTINWYQSLLNYKSELMIMPIKEGKFSVKEIIAHLYKWDEFLLNIGIPSILENGRLQFPNIDEYNSNAAKESMNIEFASVIELAIKRREAVVKSFLENESFSEKEISINGHTQKPNSNENYTFYYLLEDFSEHDKHHIRQVEEFLHVNNT